jgi:hypothetical protein
VNHKNLENPSRKTFETFFGSTGFKREKFENFQDLDFEGLKGRLCSSSYIPTAEGPVFSTMITELKDLFDRHQAHGRVRIRYQTLVFSGPVSS